MAVSIYVPTALRNFTGGNESVAVEAATVSEALGALIATHPNLKKHLYNDEGQLRHFVNVYVNDEDIRYLDKGDTKLKAGDTVSIVPSIAGGTAGLQDDGAHAGELRNDENLGHNPHLLMPRDARARA